MRRVLGHQRRGETVPGADLERDLASLVRAGPGDHLGVAQATIVEIVETEIRVELLCLEDRVRRPAEGDLEMSEAPHLEHVRFELLPGIDPARALGDAGVREIRRNMLRSRRSSRE